MKVLEISSCDECPLLYFPKNGKARCSHNDAPEPPYNEIPLAEYTDTVPEFCPLPDEDE